MAGKDINPDGAVDLAMLRAGKEKFQELYELSEEKRNKLRESDAYRLALMDLWEIAASARGMATTKSTFYTLFGQSVYGVMTEKVRITG